MKTSVLLPCLAVFAAVTGVHAAAPAGEFDHLAMSSNVARAIHPLDPDPSISSRLLRFHLRPLTYASKFLSRATPKLSEPTVFRLEIDRPVQSGATSSTPENLAFGARPKASLSLRLLPPPPTDQESLW